MHRPGRRPHLERILLRQPSHGAPCHLAGAGRHCRRHGLRLVRHGRRRDWQRKNRGRGPEDDVAFTGRLDRLVDVARRLRNPGKAISGGTHSVLLHPRVVEGYVMGTLLHHLDGSTVSHSEGLFSRDQFGTNQPVLREDLSLRLDPLEPLRSGSYRFTSEGDPARACSFIERGCLVQPVLDVKYSRRLGLPTTALPQSMDTLHPGRSDTSGPGPGTRTRRKRSVGVIGPGDSHPGQRKR